MATTAPDQLGADAASSLKNAPVVVTTTAVSEPAKPNVRNQLKVNDVLENGQSLISSNGRFSFVNQDDGNIVLYDKEDGNRVLWSSNTYRYRRGKIVMQADGNVVGAAWSSDTAGKGNATSIFVLQDDGNAVVISDGNQIYQTNTRQRIDETQPLKASESLKGNQAISSPNGKYRLVMQADNNLCLFDKSNGNSLLWSTGTRTGNAKPKLILGNDGNLWVFCGDYGSWSSKTAGKGDGSSTLSVKDDGDVVIRSKNMVIWSTGTRERTGNLNRLVIGEAIKRGQALISPNGKYQFGIQSDDNLALCDMNDNKRVIWSVKVNTSNMEPKLLLQPDGNLVVPNEIVFRWSSNTAGKGDESSVLQLQDDGDVVLRSKNVQIWSLGTRQKVTDLNTLVAGESITRGTSIKSLNGRYQFTVEANSDLVLYDVNNNKRILFVSGSRTQESSNPKLVLQQDGSLVVQDGFYTRWTSNTAGKGDGSSVLRVQDDGNVVLTSNNNVLWSTNTKQRSKTNSISVGESLPNDETLISANQRYKLVMQGNGDLEIYDIGKDPRMIWSAHSDGSGPAKAILQDDGNLVVYRNGERKWESGSRGSNALLTMQDDGNLVMTSGTTKIWSSGSRQRQAGNEDRLLVGETLYRDQALVSPNRRHKLILQGDGNFVLYEDGKATWAAVNTGDANSVKIHEDDNLIIVRRDWSNHWSTATRRRIDGGSATLIMQDNGKVALKAEDYVIWSNDPSLVNAPPPKLISVSSGVSQLKRGEHLLPNQFLTSPNGQWNAKLQADGNFAIRHKTSDIPVWKSHTTPISAVSKLVLQYDCNLAMITGDGSAIWASNTSSIYGDRVLRLQDDGNLVLGGEGKAWATQIKRYPAANGTIKELGLGESLLQTQSLTSANGQYKLTFSDHGTLCISNNGQPTYYYNCMGRSDAKYITFEQPDWGQRPVLRVLNGKGEELWVARTRESERGRKERQAEEEWKKGSQWAESNRFRADPNVKPYQRPQYDPTRFTLGDDGVAYISFENDMIFKITELDKGTTPVSPSCLRAGQEMTTKQTLVSSNGEYTLRYQDDGNLVVYSRLGPSYWASGSRNGFFSSGKVVQQFDGALACFSNAGTLTWSSPGRGSGDVCTVMEGDANLVTYVNGQKVWGGRG